MRCYKCGSTDNVGWQSWGKNGTDIAICRECEWKYFINHVDTANLSEEDKKYVQSEKKKLKEN
jgi:AAA+ ATPase superfamily predicted ATPase